MFDDGYKFNDRREVGDRQVGWCKLDDMEVPGEALLLAKGLWGVVDGTEEPTEDAAARAEFQKKLQKALSTVVLAINTSQMYLVTLYV